MHPQDNGSTIGGLPFSPVEAGQEVVAKKGEPLAEGKAAASPEAVVEALRTVYDPEIPVNIYDLGLIYECDIKDNGDVSVKMTVTAPACPVAGELPGQVADAVATLDNTGEVDVTLVWDPPWTPDMMTEDARLALGM
ncbi:MAG: DUF59 domain-containing protein [Rhodospirillales bacterium]|jgi:FeS assembly SUF system protein